MKLKKGGFMNMLNEIVSIAKQQGLSFVLLIAAVWWMNAKNEQLDKKVDSCNQMTIEMYKEQNEDLKEVVQLNTRAIENFSFYLKERSK